MAGHFAVTLRFNARNCSAKRLEADSHMKSVGMQQGVGALYHCHMPPPEQQIAALRGGGMWQRRAKRLFLLV